MDQSSVTHLENVHPKQRELVTKLITTMIALGYDARVTQGLRTAAEQQKLYNQGRTTPGKRVTNARPWESNHNYGFGNDITIYKNGKPDWNDLKPYQILGREAEKLGLEWGGRWRSVDMPHVQLKGMSIKECQTFYRKGGLKAVWARMDQILGGAPKTVFIPKENELLEFGDKGAAVERLQRDLATLGFIHAHEIDGEFGKNTKNAVIGFQRQNKLTADGIVGPGTRAKLTAAVLNKNSEITPENVGQKIDSISAAVPASKPSSDDPSTGSSGQKPVDSPAVVANVSGNKSNQLPNEQPPIQQNADAIVNLGSDDSNLAQTEDKPFAQYIPNITKEKVLFGGGIVGTAVMNVAAWYQNLPFYAQLALAVLLVLIVAGFIWLVVANRKDINRFILEAMHLKADKTKNTPVLTTEKPTEIEQIPRGFSEKF